MALKDLVRKGPAPNPAPPPPPSSVRMSEAGKPYGLEATEDSETWCYEDKKGILVVHEIKVNGNYVRTDQFTIPWSKVFSAAKRRQYTLDLKKWKWREKISDKHAVSRFGQHGNL